MSETVILNIVADTLEVTVLLIFGWQTAAKYIQIYFIFVMLC